MENLDRLTDAVARRLFVELEASGRHVHVTEAQAQQLFGHGLTPKRPLSQPGQYLAEERVTVTGPKGSLERVAVLGPARKEAQVEVSRTDAVAWGVQPPVRLSGDVGGTPPVTLTGPNGELRLERGLMVARRHIHMTPDDAALPPVQDGDTVRLQTLTSRPVIFEDVAVRLRPDFRPYAHLAHADAHGCRY